MGITELKEREKQLRRTNIIDAAEQLFFKDGFDNVSMDQIAQKAELAKGTLYLYFKSREELHYSIVSRVLDMIYKVLKDRYDAKICGAENLLIFGNNDIALFHTVSPAHR